jgi:hypothetical protein
LRNRETTGDFLRRGRMAAARSTTLAVTPRLGVHLPFEEPLQAVS